MSYNPAPVADVDIDVINTGWPASYSSTNQILPIVGAGGRTRATIASNQITIYAGSHWRLEWSPSQTVPTNFNGFYEAQFYNVTDSVYIGLDTRCATPLAGDLRKCRTVCSAIILDSDITTSMTLEVRFSTCSTNLRDGDASGYEIHKFPTIRVFEIPA